MLGKEHIKMPGPDRGMAFRGYTPYRRLTERKYIALGPRLASVPVKESRDQSYYLLNWIAPSKLADAFPRELSAGMNQRVAIDPRILLMDEPFGALDGLTRGLLQELITPVRAETNKRIPFANHNIEKADFVGQRKFVINARPVRIKEVDDFDLPYPRGIETLSEPKCPGAAACSVIYSR